MNDLNDLVVAEFRANEGRVVNAAGGHFKDIHLLLLHNTGRRSGRPYVTPLLYAEDADTCVLVGSNGGAEKEPTWVANVAAAPQVVIELGDRTMVMNPTILRQGPEWERLYAAAIEYWPDIVGYQTHTTRTFPLIVLHPTEGRDVGTIKRSAAELFSM